MIVPVKAATGLVHEPRPYQSLMAYLKRWGELGRSLFRPAALWALWVVAIVLLTSMPWSNIRGQSHWGTVRWIPFQDGLFTLRPLADIVLNLFLYAPFGYLYVQCRPRVGKTVVLSTALLAALLSASTELLQVFSHNRIPSMTDIIMNVLGSTTGATIALNVPRRGLG